MTELLNALFARLAVMGEMSLTAAYVAAIVAGLRLVLKKCAPKGMICLLWLVVFARLLVPVSLESPLSIVPAAQEVQLTQDLPREPEGGGQGTPVQIPAQKPEPVWSPAPVQPGNTVVYAAQGSPAAAPVLTIPGGVTPNVPRPRPAEPFPWEALLAGVWLAGALAMGGYGLASWLLLRRRLFDAIRAQDGAWEHPSVGSPFILGILRPRIYLPAGMRGQSRQFILCHERAHLRRLDHIVKPICWAALALHWFNPAVWAAFILMSRDIEAACDEAVIRQLGVEVRADYSETLLALAIRGRMPAPCPLAFDEGDAKGRIQNVLRYRRPALWMAVVSVVMVIMAAVCLLTDPVSAKEPEGPDTSVLDTEDPASQEPEPKPEPLPVVPDWAEEVLSGKRQFYSVSQGKKMDLQPLNLAYNEPDGFYDLDYKLAVADLDGDGEDEVILEPCYIGTSANESDQNLLSLGYFILHAEEDEVYGYTPGYTAFTEIKVGGVCQFFAYDRTSDYNAYDSGWGHVRFTDEGMEPDPLLRVRNRAGVYPEDTAYYINGEPVDMEEYYREFEHYNMLPAVSWYRWYEDTGLLPAVVMADQSTYTPKFLGGGLRELYRQASYFYYHLFGENTSAICGMESSYWSSSLYDPTDTIERDGLTYVRATGQYARWSDLMAAADALFTREFWDACNQWDGHELFIDVDGDTYFLPASRLQGDYCRTEVTPFKLAEQTEDSVTVTLTAGYNRYQAGEDEAAWGQRLERGHDDYTVDYTIRYVKTEDGWRLDEFHYPRSDRWEYVLGDILWQTDPLHAVNGWMDDVTLRQVGPDTLLDWLGTTYNIGPEVNVNSFCGRMYVLDVDGDGQTEAALVYRNEDDSSPLTVSAQNMPVIAVYERTERGLRHTTFDTGTLLSLFDNHVTVERNPEGGLTVTHHGAQEDTAIRLSNQVFEGYDWLREGELYVVMEPDIFYAGLFSEAPLTPPFAVSTYAYLANGDGHGPYMAHVAFAVDYDGDRLIPGKLYLEPYLEFALEDS